MGKPVIRFDKRDQIIGPARTRIDRHSIEEYVTLNGRIVGYFVRMTPLKNLSTGDVQQFRYISDPATRLFRAPPLGLWNSGYRLPWMREQVRRHILKCYDAALYLSRDTLHVKNTDTTDV